MADLGEGPLRRNLGDCNGSSVPLEQHKLEAENWPLKVSNPEADLGQFVLPAMNRPSQLHLKSLPSGLSQAVATYLMTQSARNRIS